MTGFGKTLILLALLLVIGGGYIGYARFTGDTQPEDISAAHNHVSEEEVASVGHSHEMLDPINTDEPITLSIEVTSDTVSGFNVQLMTEGFTFAPENVGGEHVDGEGHAHIYVDGVKISRVYGEWYHLSGLSAGEHELRVTLNTNSHNDYAIDGEVLEDTTTIVVE